MVGLVLFSTLAVLGVVAAICGNPGHLFFTAIPCTAIALAEYAEYRQKKRKTILKKIQQ